MRQILKQKRKTIESTQGRNKTRKLKSNRNSNLHSQLLPMTAQNRVSCLTHFGIAIPKRSIQRQSRPGEKITIAQQINSSNLSLGSGEARFARYGAGKGQPRAALTANRPPSRRPRPRTRARPREAPWADGEARGAADPHRRVPAPPVLPAWGPDQGSSSGAFPTARGPVQRPHVGAE